MPVETDGLRATRRAWPCGLLPPVKPCKLGRRPTACKLSSSTCSGLSSRNAQDSARRRPRRRCRPHCPASGREKEPFYCVQCARVVLLSLVSGETFTFHAWPYLPPQTPLRVVLPSWVRHGTRASPPTTPGLAHELAWSRKCGPSRCTSTRGHQQRSPLACSHPSARSNPGTTIHGADQTRQVPLHVPFDRYTSPSRPDAGEVLARPHAPQGHRSALVIRAVVPRWPPRCMHRLLFSAREVVGGRLRVGPGPLRQARQLASPWRCS